MRGITLQPNCPALRVDRVVHLEREGCEIAAFPDTDRPASEGEQLIAGLSSRAQGERWFVAIAHERDWRGIQEDGRIRLYQALLSRPRVESRWGAILESFLLKA